MSSVPTWLEPETVSFIGAVNETVRSAPRRSPFAACSAVTWAVVNVARYDFDFFAATLIATFADFEPASVIVAEPLQVAVDTQATANPTVLLVLLVVLVVTVVSMDVTLSGAVSLTDFVAECVPFDGAVERAVTFTVRVLPEALWMAWSCLVVSVSFRVAVFFALIENFLAVFLVDAAVACTVPLQDFEETHFTLTVSVPLAPTPVASPQLTHTSQTTTHYHSLVR